MKVKMIIATVIFVATAFTVSAQNGKTLKDENHQIRQGVKSGELTASETIRLKKQQSKLKRETVRFKTNDGNIGPAERVKLRRDEKRLDRNIRRQKHDGQTRH